MGDVSAQLIALGGEGDGGLEALFPGHESVGVASEVDMSEVIGRGPDGDDGSAVTLSDNEVAIIVAIGPADASVVDTTHFRRTVYEAMGVGACVHHEHGKGP